MVGFVEAFLPGGVALPEIVAGEAPHVVVGLAIFGDVGRGMGHGVGVVMRGQTLASERRIASTIVAFDVRAEIVDIPAELNGVSSRNGVIAFSVERIACAPEGPLHKRIHVVRVLKLTDLRLHRRFEGDGQTRVTSLIHIP